MIILSLHLIVDLRLTGAIIDLKVLNRLSPVTGGK